MPVTADTDTGESGITGSEQLALEHDQPPAPWTMEAAQLFFLGGDSDEYREESLGNHWSVPWSDLMMSMFVLFAALVTAQALERKVPEYVDRVKEQIVEKETYTLDPSFEPLMRGAAGWQLHPQLDHLDADAVLDKTASDAFYATDLHTQLQNAGIQKVIVCGLQTEYCVDTTCRAAISLGYQTCLLSDGHTTGDAQLSAAQIIEHHNIVLSQLAHPNGSATLLASSAW